MGKIGCGNMGTLVLSSLFFCKLKMVLKNKSVKKKISLLRRIRQSLGMERAEGSRGSGGQGASWRKWHLSRDRKEVQGEPCSHLEPPGRSGGGASKAKRGGGAGPALDSHLGQEGRGQWMR